MQNIWFSADLHLLHPDIIKYTKRPISIEDHDEWIISRINERVSKKDTLFLLGDISMSSRKNTEKLLHKIHGKKHLIIGNHDKNLKNSPLFISRSLIKNISPFVKNKKQLIVLCHYPITSWENKIEGSLHLFGHVHGRYEGPKNTWDVGLDNNDYYPISLEELIIKINNKNERFAKK